MSKDEVLRAFSVALDDRGAMKDGNVLADELRRRGESFLMKDRSGLVDAVKEWLCSDDAG